MIPAEVFSFHRPEGLGPVRFNGFPNISVVEGNTIHHDVLHGLPRYLSYTGPFLVCAWLMDTISHIMFRVRYSQSLGCTKP